MECCVGVSKETVLQVIEFKNYSTVVNEFKMCKIYKLNYL